MSAAAKAAYQRRHNLLPRQPLEGPSVEEQVPPKVHGTATKSALEKRHARGSKEAYLRRHGLFMPLAPAPASSAPSPALSEEPKPHYVASSSTSSSAEPGEKTWAQRRKENILARSGSRPRPKEADIAATALSFASKLKVRARQSAQASAAADASTEPLKPGELCEVTSAKQAGLATFVALVDASEGLDESHAFVKMRNGKRAVVPLAHLHRHVETAGTTKGSPPRMVLSSADMLLSAGTWMEELGQRQEEANEELDAESKVLVQQKRALKRGRGERRSKEARAYQHQHAADVFTC